MPRRKSRGNDDDTTSGAPASLTPVPLSEGTLSSFLEAFAKAQAESNRQLVQSLLATSANNVVASPSPSPAPTKQGNFARCTARFSGSCRDSEAFEAFVDSIEIYKECTSISDEHAFRGLPMLLEGEAAVWFRGVKSSVSSWKDALQRLRAMYGVSRPPHKLFRDIFAAEQKEERTEVFVARLRSLIAKLPYIVENDMEVDMIYGLLHRRIRKRLTRESVNNLDMLVEKARNIEESLSEVSNEACGRAASAHAPHTPSPQPRPAPLARALSASATCAPSAPVDIPNGSSSATSSAPPPPTVVNNNNTGEKGKRLFCVYCRKVGHTRDSCKKY